MIATDLHAHFVPPAVAALLRQRRTAPRIETLADGSEQLLRPIGSMLFGRTYTDIEKRLALMDEIGIRRQIISLPGLFGIDSLPVDESRFLTQTFNESVAAIGKNYPQRFLGLASLPLANMEVAVDEFRRARTALGLIGAILPSIAFTSLAEAKKMDRLFAVADKLGGHFFIHPGQHPDEAIRSLVKDNAPRLPERDSILFRRALEIQTELGEAMLTLLFTDFLERYPNVSIQVANLGGTLPAVIERIDHIVGARTPGSALHSRRPNRVYVDCASLGPHTLELAVAIYGSDSIVFGTDCPIFQADSMLASVHRARLTDADRAAILSDNAEKLLARFSFCGTAVSA